MTFDRTGSYTLIFVAGGLITATGSLWLALIRRPTWAQVEMAHATPVGAVPLLDQPAQRA
jgi:hypothetical protein